ncbi:MAG: 2'-5' RNA ligase [Lachnospiraceae bacterium]|nr:2'-5' RNA ligase [Lachnospiraceae bacterium]
MGDKNLYILAGYDDQTEEILSGLQKHLYEKGFSGTQTKDIPMHFTLGSFGPEQEHMLKARLKEISETFSEFEVSFNHIGLFRLPESDVLFVAPEVTKEMLGLKDHFWDNIDPFPWSAHTTLLIDKPEVIQSAIPEVMSEFKAFRGRVQKLYLYEFWPARLITTVELR